MFSCVPGKDHLLIALGAVSQTRHDCYNQCENTHILTDRTCAHIMWEVSLCSLKTYRLAATMVFIKTLAWCESDEEIVMGMTRGVDVTAHPLKGIISRPRTTVFALHTRHSFSPLSCSLQWELAQTSGSWGLLHHVSLLVSFLSSH